jgi:hypothetical protein
MTSTTNGDDDQVKHAKRIAKTSGIPWQLIHGSAPQEMLDNPDAYNWDGTPKAQFKRPSGEAGGGKIDLNKYRRSK